MLFPLLGILSLLKCCQSFCFLAIELLAQMLFPQRCFLDFPRSPALTLSFFGAAFIISSLLVYALGVVYYMLCVFLH